ncbi:hypothetical protein [Microbacterium sp. CFBP9034]|uniref:hypothetical protein n=1 Tax=Microbacterium sp. CFBP9034 TaxID=3096540 RepID=UPI002A6B46AF|nr:hypothetical protein [Microbacterium sp. CFBP9034]MDY0909484.1 hypothetical protein [Microbacterium sp. CFBP9034]
MTRDPLDDLLDRSAPAARAATESDLEAMIGAARREVPPRRRRRIAALSGALAIVLVGGAGVATATDGFRWIPWVQEPVGAVSFTMPNGLDCELRFSEYRGGADPTYVAEVNRALEEWYRTADVVAEAQALLPQKREHYAAMRTAEEQAALEAQLAELSPTERAEEMAHNAWVDEWIAWDLVVSDLETQALRDVGFTIPDPGLVDSERNGQIQCFDVDGEPYPAGAGS